MTSTLYSSLSVLSCHQLTIFVGIVYKTKQKAKYDLPPAPVTLSASTNTIRVDRIDNVREFHGQEFTGTESRGRLCQVDLCPETVFLVRPNTEFVRIYCFVRLQVYLHDILNICTIYKIFKYVSLNNVPFPFNISLSKSNMT